MKLDLHFDEFYPHPRDAVWHAITDPKAIAAWLMPNDFVPQVGRRFSMKREPPPPLPHGTVECEVLVLEPPSRMVWSWIHNKGDDPGRVEFRLQEVEGGTRLTLSHTGEIDALTGERLREGWPGKLADLRKELGRTA